MDFRIAIKKFKSQCADLLKNKIGWDSGNHMFTYKARGHFFM